MKKFTICKDREFYKAWPDLVLAPDGRMICVFNECVHHMDRSDTRIVLTESFDRGRTWGGKRPVTENTRGRDYYYNCPRLSLLSDGSLALVVDRLDAEARRNGRESCREIQLRRSFDNGVTWSEPVTLPLQGIVPDQLLELSCGRWIIAAHRDVKGMPSPLCIYSDDRGASWSDEILIAHSPEFRLVEPSLLALGDSDIVAFLRENSNQGFDCKKVISHDNGESWGPLIDFPLPGCHRPVARRLISGRILITYRFVQGGGRGKFGGAAQNFFAALTDQESALATDRDSAAVRIMPVDYDRSIRADLGYSGQVQFADGELYLATYIVDDAIDNAQIRGYVLHENEFIL